MNLLSLPVVMIEHIFSFLTYDDVAKTRIICKDFDTICQRLLNRGFFLIERRHSLSLRAIKSQLPRRESERRFHAFSRHCDILTSIETRLSMLSMTYSKFMDHNVCCFIPGKVIDEIRRVLYIVERSAVLPRAHEVLQELRDISSMAIEHFDDKVSPTLRQKMQAQSGQPCRPVNPITPNPVPSGVEPPPMCSLTEFAEIRARCIKSHRGIIHITERYSKVLKQMKLYKKLISAQNHLIKELSRRQADQDCCMAELRRRIEECDVKYQELTHSQTSGGKGMKAIVASSLCGPSSLSMNKPSSVEIKNFGSQIKLDPSLYIGTSNRDITNIKPRKSTLHPPSREHSSDLQKRHMSSSNTELNLFADPKSTSSKQKVSMNYLAAKKSSNSECTTRKLGHTHSMLRDEPEVEQRLHVSKDFRQILRSNPKNKSPNALNGGFVERNSDVEKLGTKCIGHYCDMTKGSKRLEAGNTSKNDHRRNMDNVEPMDDGTDRKVEKYSGNIQRRKSYEIRSDLTEVERSKLNSNVSATSARLPKMVTRSACPTASSTISHTSPKSDARNSKLEELGVSKCLTVSCDGDSPRNKNEHHAERQKYLLNDCNKFRVGEKSGGTGPATPGGSRKRAYSENCKDQLARKFLKANVDIFSNISLEQTDKTNAV